MVDLAQLSVRLNQIYLQLGEAEKQINKLNECDEREQALSNVQHSMAHIDRIVNFGLKSEGK